MFTHTFILSVSKANFVILYIIQLIYNTQLEQQVKRSANKRPVTEEVVEATQEISNNAGNPRLMSDLDERPVKESKVICGCVYIFIHSETVFPNTRYLQYPYLRHLLSRTFVISTTRYLKH